MKKTNIYRSLLLALCMGCLQLATPAAVADECGGGYSAQLKIRGKVENRLKITLDDLLEYPVVSLTTTVYAGSAGLVTRTYRGVPLLELLQTAGIRTDAAVKHDIIRKMVRITASDCYQAVLAVADLLPEFVGQQVLLAYDVDGELLQENGFVQLVIAGDKKASRYIANITDIRIE